MSIPRAQTPSATWPFSRLIGTAGDNTGNLLFTHAAWEQITDVKERIGFSFSPAKLNASLRALVIPAANWLGPHVDFSDLADRVEQLDIPVILIGLGAQDADYSGTVNVPEGTLRFIRAVSERSNSISVRGAYTRDILEGFGIRNVKITGCPSLYQELQPNSEEKLRESLRHDTGRTLLHSTRYTARYRPFIDTPSVHLDIFRFAFRSQSDILVQSEPEEISLLVEASEKPELDEVLRTSLVELYDAPDWRSLRAYILKHTKVFFDVPSWSGAMGNYRSAFGTRLHATIMALNSGVPAVLVNHDSRTREVSEFACIPSVNARDVEVGASQISALFSSADYDPYFAARQNNLRHYAAFLADNGIEPALALSA